jgi:hypothetical protein
MHLFVLFHTILCSAELNLAGSRDIRSRFISFYSHNFATRLITTHSVTLAKRKNMVKVNSSLCRRSATDAVERLSKRSRTECLKRKGHLSSSPELLFASLRPAEQEQLILGFPVIEWDSDDEDETDYSSDSEGSDEALCRETAKLLVLSPIATAVRPRRLSYPQDPVMSVRECGLVRSKAFLSHLSLMDSGP